MKKFLIVIVLLSYGSCSRWEKPTENAVEKPSEPIVGEINIIPQPTSIRRIGGQFELNTKTKIVATDESGVRASITLNEALMENYGFMFDVTDQPNLENTITFSTAATREDLDAEEGYTLKIDPKYIEIKGTERGMFYAVQSLRQLLPLDSVGTVKIPAAEITDAPRFSYRGMHLDVGRHFMPAEFIKKYIGLLSLYKYNYFHWHLTDDQGWRIEIKKYPLLTDIGSKRRETVIGKNYRPHIGDGIPVEGYYTQEQIRDIVAYAETRHITIIPEIDLPGHSSAALAAYPEYGCKDNYQYKVQTTWGGFHEIYCPTESTFNFIEDVLSEVMDLFPNSPYIHIGGDEVKTDHWRESRFVQELMRREKLRDEKDIQSWFIRRIGSFVNSRGKKIIGWDEIFEDDVESSAVIMSWHGFKPGIQAARAKHNVIMTPSDVTYFNHPQGDTKFEPLGLGDPLTLEDVYKFDPVPPELNSEDANYVIGAQGCVWTEFMKRPEDIEYMTFPRALALAEVLWSTQRVKNFAGFSKRLYMEFSRLDRKNVNYRIPKPYGLVDRSLSAGEKANVNLALPIPNGKIYFTLNGTNPNRASNLYREPFTLNLEPNTAVELRTKVIKSNGRESPVYTAKYVWQGKSFVDKTYNPLSEKSEVMKKNGRKSQ